MVEEVGGIHYHHFHRNHTWVGKCPMGSGRLYMGTKAAKRAVSHGKKTAFADVYYTQNSDMQLNQTSTKTNSTGKKL